MKTLLLTSPEQLAAILDEYKTTYRRRLKKRPEPGYKVLNIRELPDGKLGEVIGQVELMLERKFESGIWTQSQIGHEVHKHTDSVKTRYSRWHLPVQTEGTVLYENDIPHVMREGAWTGPVQYWLPHSVDPPKEKTRIHFIADFR